MAYDSLITMKRSRQRMHRELTKWLRQNRQWTTPQAVELSLNRGIVLLAELVAIHHEIEERQAAIEMGEPWRGTLPKREAGLEMEGEANGPDV